MVAKGACVYGADGGAKEDGNAHVSSSRPARAPVFFSARATTPLHSSTSTAAPAWLRGYVDAGIQSLIGGLVAGCPPGTDKLAASADPSEPWSLCLLPVPVSLGCQPVTQR